MASRFLFSLPHKTALLLAYCHCRARTTSPGSGSCPMTTQPTQPRPPNIAHRPNRKAPFADRLRRRATVKTMLTLGMRFKSGLTALTCSTVDPRRTRETIVLLEISRWASYSVLGRRPRPARLRARLKHRRQILTITHEQRGQARQRVSPVNA